MKKDTKEISFFILPSTKILFRFIAIAFVTVLAVSLILPTLLNYPPNSINTQFDIDMSGIPYIAQISIIFIVVAIALTILVKTLFRSIDNWYKNPNKKKYNDYKTIEAIRNKCFSLPYILFFCELLLPVVGIILVLALTGSHHPIMIFKIILLFGSFLLFFAASSYIFSKNLYSQILIDTYSERYKRGIRVSLKDKILLQIVPISIMGVLLTALIAYSQVVKTEEDFLFDSYKYNLEKKFDSYNPYNSSDLIKDFSEFELQDISHSKFIIYPDGSYITISGFDPSDFMVKYTIQLSEQNNGRTYDGYGIDTQGTAIKVNTEDGIYTLVVSYSVASSDTLILLLIDFLFIVLITIIFLDMFGNGLIKDINVVTDSLDDIADSSSGMTKLPVISNDELGDLAIAYNKVQAVSDKNLKQIENNQELLIERERLASLGQMVGGIAHNLKTPIMSLSGVSEALTQLVNEFDHSIGNPVVTEEDYHEIANDMREWIEKLKTHTSYMSDVITVVKGQTVTFSDSQIFSFTVDTVFKQVDILMKHELNSALITLRVTNNIDNSYKIVGNINSLIQILNNIISNAIQAYNGKSNEFIDLSANLRDNTTIEIVVKDYGPGIPDNVKENLFKKMVTTKGKSGTGLGLFMSYSNIKAHFKGNLTFETEKNKGTSFIITLPINDGKGV